MRQKEFWERNFKNLSLDLESASLRYYMHQFSDKRNNFQLFCQNLLKKWILGSEFQKFKSRFGISNLKTVSARIFRQNQQLRIFRPKFAQKWILGLKYQKSKSRFRITILETLWAPIFRQNGRVRSFGCKFAKK